MCCGSGKLTSFPETALSQYGRLTNDSKESKPHWGKGRWVLWNDQGFEPGG